MWVSGLAGRLLHSRGWLAKASTWVGGRKRRDETQTRQEPDSSRRGPVIFLHSGASGPIVHQEKKGENLEAAAVDTYKYLR